MNLSLFLIPALGGYYLLSRTLFWRYWVARQAGYKLFFSSAIAGAGLLLLARAITASWPLDFAAPLLARWQTFAPFDYAGTLAISAVLAVGTPLLVNRFLDENHWALRAARAHGDLVECLMQEALDSGRLVEVTTKSGKSYIGFALESAVAADEEPDIAITPVVSGYRKSETHELVITTDYLPVLLEQRTEHPDFLERFRVVIPLAEVSSARHFDPKAYRLFLQIDSNEKDAAGSRPAI